MAWALAMIVILGIGVPIGAWRWTRLRPPPAVTPLGAGYDPIDKWLLQRYSLPPAERERVRAAVFRGRHAGGLELEPAAHDLAARVLAGESRVVRLGRALMRFNCVIAAGFLVTGIVLLVISSNASGRALGALGLLDSGMLAFAAVMSARQLKRMQCNATMALRLNRERS